MMKKQLIVELALIGIVLVAAITALAVQKHMQKNEASKDSAVCCVQMGSSLVWQGELAGIREKHIRVNGPLGVSEVEISEGRVRMRRSPCPDKICEKAGWIDSGGETIICVPQKIIISVESKKGHKEIDEIAW